MTRGRKPAWPPQPKTRRGKWYVRVPDGSGGYSEVTLGPAGSDEARQELARIVAETAVTGKPAGSVIVKAAVAEYLEGRVGRDEHRTFHRRTLALQVVFDLYGHRPLASFGPLALKTCRASWVAAGYARTYCNDLANCVRAWIKWCVSQELLPATAAAALDAVAGLRVGESAAPELEPRLPADPAVVAATLPHLARVPRAMVEVQLLTGMRPGEVCRLSPGMIDRSWMVVGGVPVWLARLKAHKGRWRGHKREVPIGPQAQAVLAPFLLRAAAAPCFSVREMIAERLAARKSPKSRAKEDPAWRPADGFGVRRYDKHVARACASAGVEPWTPHQLRHRVGTDIYTDFGMDDAQAVLGHDSPDATAIYAKRLERAARVIAQIG